MREKLVRCLERLGGTIIGTENGETVVRLYADMYALCTDEWCQLIMGGLPDGEATTIGRARLVPAELTALIMRAAEAWMAPFWPVIQQYPGGDRVRLALATDGVSSTAPALRLDGSTIWSGAFTAARPDTETASQILDDVFALLEYEKEFS